MIVLFAPAKTFRDIEEIKDEELIFKNKTNEIVSILSKLDYKTIIEFFNVSDDIANEVKEYYEDFYNKPTHLAFRFFYGQSFQSFDFDNLDKKHYSFLNSNVYIIDALYGIIKPLNPIRKYRLDFHTKNLSLKSFWKKDVNSYFKNLKSNEILSLASKEFTSLLDKNLNVVEVSFLDYINNAYKQISVYNKQMRGKLLRYIVENEIDCIKDLPYNIGEYVLDNDRSTNNTIIYIRKKKKG